MHNSEKVNNGRNHKKCESAADTSGSSSSSSSSESLFSSDSSTVSMPPPPDGGYGWVIVLSAFFVSLISDGISFSFGILYTDLLAYFEESKSLTSWIGSVFYGTCMIGGPLASALATKFGCRKVTILGGLLCASGIFISSFVDSIGMLCFWFGFVSGLGMAMGYVTSVVMVAFYFEKKRALATGLSVCGSGIGTFVFAPFTETLLSLYGWRGCLVIWSGIVLNLCVCGCLFRPLKFTPEEKKVRALRQFERMSEKMSRTMSCTSFRSQSRHASQSEMNSSEIEVELDELEHCHSQIQIPTFIKEKKVDIPIEVLKEAKTNNGLLRNYIKTLGSLEDDLDNPMEITISSEKNEMKNSASEKEIRGNNVETEVISNGKGENIQIIKQNKERKSCLKKPDGTKKHQPRPKHVQLESYLPLYRKDIFYRGNLMKLSMPGQIKSTSCPALYTSHWDDSDSSDDEWDWAFWKYLHVSKPLKRVMKIMFDPTILKHPLYILFALSSFILYFWYDVPYIFLADRALEYGISDKQASFLISILGIVNTFGQIIYGVLGDRNISLSILYGTSVVSCGLTVMMVPFFTSYTALAVLSGTFGFFISANYSLVTVILVEFLGIDKLSNAYGLTMLMQGIANLIGPPVAGLLYDYTGTYDATFFVGGVGIILSGILLLLVPIYRYIRNRRFLKWRLPTLNLDIAKEDEVNKDDVNKTLDKEENMVTEPTAGTALLVTKGDKQKFNDTQDELSVKSDKNVCPSLSVDIKESEV